MPVDPPPKGGMQILGLPWWAWLAAAGGGLLIGFVFLRKKNNVPTMIGQSSPLDNANAGARQENGAPADQLSSDVLAALGYLAEGQATIGETLAQILAGGGNSTTFGSQRGFTDPQPTTTTAAPLANSAVPFSASPPSANPLTQSAPIAAWPGQAVATPGGVAAGSYYGTLSAANPTAQAPPSPPPPAPAPTVVVNPYKGPGGGGGRNYAM